MERPSIASLLQDPLQWAQYPLLCLRRNTEDWMRREDGVGFLHYKMPTTVFPVNIFSVAGRRLADLPAMEYADVAEVETEWEAD